MERCGACPDQGLHPGVVSKDSVVRGRVWECGQSCCRGQSCCVHAVALCRAVPCCAALCRNLLCWCSGLEGSAQLHLLA